MFPPHRMPGYPCSKHAHCWPGLQVAPAKGLQVILELPVQQSVPKVEVQSRQRPTLVDAPPVAVRHLPSSLSDQVVWSENAAAGMPHELGP